MLCHEACVSPPQLGRGHVLTGLTSQAKDETVGRGRCSQPPWTGEGKINAYYSAALRWRGGEFYGHH